MSKAVANQLFVAYLGRPADLAWQSSTAAVTDAMNNAPSAALQTAFYNAAVADGRFSASDSSSTLVNKIFLNTFGFAASAFEQTAWSNLVANGTVTTAGLAWTIFASYLGATNVPASYQLPAQSKLVAAEAFTAALTSTANAAYSQIGSTASATGRTYLDAVVSQATAATAITNVATTIAGTTNATGSTFTLTTGTDVGSAVTGTSNNDTFVGTDTTYTTGDSIAGGSGTDTLRVTLGGANTAIVTLSSVESVVISDYNGDTVNAAQWTGVTDLTFENSTAATTVSNVATIPTNVTLKAADGNVTVTMAAAAVAGSTDAINLKYDSVVTTTARTTTLAGIETINVTSTGANNNGAAHVLTAAQVTTLNVAGDKSLDLSGAAITTVTTVDASAMTAGGVKLNLAGATLTSVKGGAGDDTFLLGATAVGTTVIAGGAGTDVLGTNIANVAGLLATTSSVTGIETLQIQDAVTLAAATTHDLSTVTGLKNITFGAALTVDDGATKTLTETISGLQSGSTVRFNAQTVNTASGGTPTDNAALVLNVTGAASSTTDSLKVIMALGSAGAATESFLGATITNVETVQFDVKSLAGKTTTITGVDDSQLTTLTLTSSATTAGLAVKAADLTTGAGFVGTLISTVDASGYAATAATGVVNVASLSGNLVATGATIKGPSSGLLVATGGAGADTFITGADGSNSSTGLTGGAGADIYNLSASTAKTDLISIATTASQSTSNDKVTGFTMSATTTVADNLNITDTTIAADVAAGTATGVTNITGQSVSGIITFGGSAAATATLTQLITAAEGIIGANAKVAAFVYAGDTYVIDNVDGSATVAAADTVVQLVGVTSATSVSATAGAAAILIS